MEHPQHVARRGAGGREIRQLERRAQRARAAPEESAVGHHHDTRRQAPARKPDAKIGADAGGLACRDRNQRRVES